MPPPRFGLMGIRHFAKSPRPDGRAKCSAWAKCLERAGRLRSGPTCVNLYYVSQKSIMHGSRLIVPGFTRRRRLVGQRVTQEGIEDECFAVSPALAWRHFVATSAAVISRRPLCAAPARCPSDRIPQGNHDQIGRADLASRWQGTRSRSARCP